MTVMSFCHVARRIKGIAAKFHVCSSLQCTSKTTSTGYTEPSDFLKKDFKIEIDPAELPFKLEMLNLHQFDKKILFNEERHEYKYEGKKMSLSVTGLISKYFEKFESEEVVEKMIKGRNWPRVSQRSCV
jgi:hypothetical protein